MTTILFNGIPNSGKSTLAYKLHLMLEHSGVRTVYLDDEVIKRMESWRVLSLCTFLESVADVAIIASCDADIKADIVLWCKCNMKIAYIRDVAKNSRDNAPATPRITDYYRVWGHYSVPCADYILDTSKEVEDNMEEILCLAKKYAPKKKS